MMLRLTLWFSKLRKNKIEPLKFRREIRDHRTRIQGISRHIFIKFQDEFPILQSLGQGKAESLISRYISLHDLPKLMDKKELKSWGWNRNTTIFEELRLRYGKTGRPPIVEDLNDLEKRLKTQALNRWLAKYTQNLRYQLKAELEVLEMIADTLDTKVYRGPELGFRPQERDAGHFLRASGFTREADIADFVEPYVRTLSLQMDALGIKTRAN